MVKLSFLSLLGALLGVAVLIMCLPSDAIYSINEGSGMYLIDSSVLGEDNKPTECVEVRDAPLESSLKAIRLNCYDQV
ncbi:unnamed protein product [Protopolystoma xenopodis]|uniref:Uncharacterized protein n=1 Tax=Protopolystoma xenopodis TaxID=117903 RepID=A0A448XMY0_9PLAT|nr:unnamed protein product [Protopolystoma xenopodis]